MTAQESIASRLDSINGRIADALAKAGRPEGSAKLLAVSKNFPAECVLDAYNAGQRLFGENRIQELASKSPTLPDDIQWHLIGHLQSNKAAKAVSLASCIHSVDSESLLARLDRIAGESGKKTEILLELNVSGEESKFGVKEADGAMRLAESAAKASSLRFTGLMTMAPFDADSKALREVFASLRRLRDKMQTSLGIALPELSMGMSGDFEEAIMEGSTIARVGSAIFGSRH